MTKFTAQWSNLLRPITNVWRCFHPISLLLTYKSVICAKIDYRCFFFDSLAHTYISKLNQFQTSGLRSIIDALKSIRSPAIEMELSCQYLNIRCRWHTGKFLFKNFYKHDSVIFNLIFEVFYSWCHVQKLLPILVSSAHFHISTHNYIFRTHKHSLYEIEIPSLVFSFKVRIKKYFLNQPLEFLKPFPPTLSIIFFLSSSRTKFPYLY